MRARMATVVLVAFVGLVLPLTSFGQTTTINFDDVTAPCCFAGTVPLTTAYESLGVTFAGPIAGTGGAIVNQAGGFGVSGYSAPNFLAFNSAVQYPSGDPAIGPETISFASPAATVSIAVGSNAGGGATLTAYNGTIQVAQGSTALSSTLAPLSVSAVVITRVVLTFTPAVLVADNLTWTSTVIPLTADDCRNGGWKTHFRAQGTPFKSQGDCLQYVK